jgi:hypothetical protein
MMTRGTWPEWIWRPAEEIPVRGAPICVIEYKARPLPAASGEVSWLILKQFFDSLLSH